MPNGWYQQTIRQELSTSLAAFTGVNYRRGSGRCGIAVVHGPVDVHIGAEVRVIDLLAGAVARLECAGSDLRERASER